MCSKAIVDCVFSSQICLPFLPGYMTTQLDATFFNIPLLIFIFPFCWIDITVTEEALNALDVPLARYLDHMIEIYCLY